MQAASKLPGKEKAVNDMEIDAVEAIVTLNKQIEQLKKDLADRDVMIGGLEGDINLLQAKLDTERAKVKSDRAVSMN